MPSFCGLDISFLVDQFGVLESRVGSVADQLEKGNVQGALATAHEVSHTVQQLKDAVSKANSSSRQLRRLG
jgi:hypothetical protein